MQKSLSADQKVSVLVVGAGPTGLAAANLLGKFGIHTLVIERDDTVASEPRAVSVDDEAMRMLQWLGMADTAAPAVRPGIGTRYYGARGQLLGGVTTPAIPAYGHPPKNPVDHGEFGRFLLDGLNPRPSVTVRMGTELVALEVGDDEVTATTRSGTGDEQFGAQFVLGCDGGRSATRRLLGIQMEGRSFAERWLVIDVVRDPHNERYAMHHGDPRRPHVIVPGGDGRCRYEFLLTAQEGAAALDFEMARQLLAPYRGDLRPGDIVRQREYVFHALLAREWRRGSVFLLGDAAHMMPPFAGQGLNTGLRDATNLAWKLAGVIRGELGSQVLESYEQERRPHAEAMIALSLRRGQAIMTTNVPRAYARDTVVALARRVRRLRWRLDDMPLKPPPQFRSGLVIELGGSDGIAGRMLPQPRVLLADGRQKLLDEVLGPWFSLLAIEPADRVLKSLGSPVWAQLGMRIVRLALEPVFPPGVPDGQPIAIADADGLLERFLGNHRECAVVVRPDRFVLGAFHADREAEFAAAVAAAAATPDPAEGASVAAPYFLSETRSSS